MFCEPYRGSKFLFRRILQGKCCMIDEILNGKVRNKVPFLLEGEKKIKKELVLTGCYDGGLD